MYNGEELAIKTDEMHRWEHSFLEMDFDLTDDYYESDHFNYYGYWFGESGGWEDSDGRYDEVATVCIMTDMKISSM